MRTHHLNGGRLHAPPFPPAACHCLLLEHGGRLTLIDTGIGLADVADPPGRIAQEIIDVAGFQFRAEDTVARRIEALGFRTADVDHIVLTHGDPDHAGGLADFPTALVHVSAEEHAAIYGGHWRYQMPQFAHGPRWQPHPASGDKWFGLESRWLPLGPGLDARLIPLFGHTTGHCGVAVRTGDRWLLHVGDAYFLRVELAGDDHPVSEVAAQRATDDVGRRASLEEVRRLARDHAAEIEMFGCHDYSEFPLGHFSGE
jgi:glyoxylase-like metal-dependent hydrolase (beta-lactamase superfamily II)